ncbi:hypothetical protein [Demequina flava]|uniref:hypothetical protein n=1 Tax=Demequina flava TaxID=1095025 RepID=UPI000784C26B|nr:hypothetical protein [Demequina flava]
MGRKKKELQNITDTDKYRAQAQDAAKKAKAAAKDASGSAKAAAKRAQDWAGPQVRTAKEWAGPQVKNAKDWAAPKAQTAYHQGARKASPYVRRAGLKAQEWTDIAHAAIVGAAIPAVIGAVESAAEEPKKKSGFGKVVIAGALVAAGTAALVVWARRDPGRDAWAGEDDEWELETDPDLTQKVRDGVNKAVDTVTGAAKQGADKATVLSKDALEKAGPTIDKVKEQAGPALDKVKAQTDDAVNKVKSQTDDAVNKVRSTLDSETEKVKSSVDTARSRATNAAVDVIDDAEDVWEDEGGSDETGETPAEKKSTAKGDSSKKSGK